MEGGPTGWGGLPSIIHWGGWEGLPTWWVNLPGKWVTLHGQCATILMMPDHIFTVWHCNLLSEVPMSTACKIYTNVALLMCQTVKI